MQNAITNFYKYKDNYDNSFVIAKHNDNYVTINIVNPEEPYCNYICSNGLQIFKLSYDSCCLSDKTILQIMTHNTLTSEHINNILNDLQKILELNTERINELQLVETKKSDYIKLLEELTKITTKDLEQYFKNIPREATLIYDLNNRLNSTNSLSANVDKVFSAAYTEWFGIPIESILFTQDTNIVEKSLHIRYAIFVYYYKKLGIITKTEFPSIMAFQEVERPKMLLHELNKYLDNKLSIVTVSNLSSHGTNIGPPNIQPNTNQVIETGKYVSGFVNLDKNQIKNDYNVVLYDNTKLSVVDAWAFYMRLKKTTDGKTIFMINENKLKPCTIVLFRDNLTNKEFLFINIHHPGGEITTCTNCVPEAPGAVASCTKVKDPHAETISAAIDSTNTCKTNAYQDIQNLLEAIKYYNHHTKPIIIVGDFNETLRCGSNICFLRKQLESDDTYEEKIDDVYKGSFNSDAYGTYNKIISHFATSKGIKMANHRVYNDINTSVNLLTLLGLSYNDNDPLYTMPGYLPLSDHYPIVSELVL